MKDFQKLDDFLNFGWAQIYRGKADNKSPARYPTFVTSSADGFPCNVFCPNTTTPCPGNDAIGLTRPSYNSSLSVCVSLVLAYNTEPKPPRFKPAGANHSCATLSVKDITPGNTTEGGTHIGLDFTGSIILIHG